MNYGTITIPKGTIGYESINGHGNWWYYDLNSPREFPITTKRKWGLGQGATAALKQSTVRPLALAAARLVRCLDCHFLNGAGPADVVLASELHVRHTWEQRVLLPTQRAGEPRHVCTHFGAGGKGDPGRADWCAACTSRSGRRE